MSVYVCDVCETAYDEADGGSELPERASDSIEIHMADIHRMAETGASIIEPMGTRQPTISWDDILIKPPSSRGSPSTRGIRRAVEGGEDRSGPGRRRGGPGYVRAHGLRLSAVPDLRDGPVPPRHHQPGSRPAGRSDVHAPSIRGLCTTNSEISGHTDIEHVLAWGLHRTDHGL